MKYGKKPEIIKPIDLDIKEFMFYMYLPIKMPGTGEAKFEDRLHPLLPLLFEVFWRERVGLEKKYVYLTVKHQFHPKGHHHNRPGWHSDGFGTNDVNYIWSNNTPTEFCIQDYDVSEDDSTSLKQFELQSKPENIVTYPDNTLIRLTPENIHRIGLKKEDGPRCFVKISVSERQYRLAGNSHNYLFDYDWDLQQRALERNAP